MTVKKSGYGTFIVECDEYPGIHANSYYYYWFEDPIENELPLKCRDCVYEERKREREAMFRQSELIEQQQRERQLAYHNAIEDYRKKGKHINDKCSSCDEKIAFEEWFCYCGLCPDCFLNSEEDVDNWLGEKPSS